MLPLLYVHTRMQTYGKHDENANIMNYVTKIRKKIPTSGTYLN